MGLKATEGYVEPNYSNESESNLIFAYCLNIVDSGTLVMEVANIQDFEINLDKTVAVGQFEPKSEFVSCVEKNLDLETAVADLFDFRESILMTEEIKRVKAVLNKYKSVISKTSTDLGMTHCKPQNCA